jgi:LmbE family N-acetylglucosaminyl deacetylase
MVVVHYKCRVAAAPDVYWLKREPGAVDKEWIEKAIAEFKPEIVYTHHDGDLNADHRALAEAVLVACRPYAAPSVRSLRMFETPSSTEWGPGPFVPNLFVDITEHVHERWETLRRHYSSEMREYPHPRSEASLMARAGFWGQQAGFRYAEPFRIVRELA